jgi:CHAD domain-containing protein
MLSQDERELLQNFADQSPPGTPYLRRALITLLNNEGFDQEDIALQLNVPLVRVRQWLRVFDRQGMGSFPGELVTLEPPFSPDDLITDAGLVIFRTLLARLLVLEEELENTVSVRSVHETRKNIRRLRTALRVFQPFFDSKELKRYQKRFRKIMRRLSRLRDYDVFLLKLEQHMEEGLVKEGLSKDTELAYGRLDQYWLERRVQVNKKAKIYLGKGKYRALLTDFGVILGRFEQGSRKNFSKDSVSQAAPVLISGKVTAVHDFNDETEGLSLARLHALRIQLKELRYTLEFFKPLMGPSAVSVIQRIRELLTFLGDLNDARVHIDMLAGNEDLGSNLAAVLYLEVLKGDLIRLRAEFPSQWALLEQESWREELASAVVGI